MAVEHNAEMLPAQWQRKIPWCQHWNYQQQQDRVWNCQSC